MLRLQSTLVAALFPLLAQAALAQGPCPTEPTLNNHTGAGSTACPCFVAGEMAGAIFDVPAAHYPIEILRVGVGWGSIFGGGSQSLEQALRIYPAGLPNPGTPIFELPGPVLTDGFINEFDLEPLPGQVIVTGGPFTVALELANASQAPFGASFVHDGAGCQPGKNVVFANPGGWTNACSLGVSGNWLFHIVYRQVNCGGDGPFCVTSANSVGSGALMGFLGSTSVGAANLNLTAVGGVPGQFGLFYYGGNELQIPFGNGFRCVGSGGVGLWRFGPQLIDVFGNAARHVDFTTAPSGVGGGQLFPGSTWKFQFWYRDPAAGGAGFNLSNGLSLTFTS